MADPATFTPIEPSPPAGEPPQPPPFPASPVSGQSPTMPGGGIILDQAPPVVYGAESPQETVVIPPSGSAPAPASSVTENPFIPKEAAPQAGPVPAAQSDGTPSGGKSLYGRILMLVVFLFILGGLVIAGRFALNFFASTKEVTITYWGLWENDGIVRNVLAAFEASHPKIKVTYVKQSPKQYRERLQAAVARGEGPDVFRFHNTWVPMLRNELSTAPKTIMTAAQFSSAFYPVLNRDLVAGANIYGIPLMIDGLGLYYNEDLLASAGVTPPSTYEELLNIVPRLTVKNQNTILSSAIALGTTNNVENFSDILATMMLQNGANLTSLTGSEIEQALIFYRKFADPSDPVYTWNETMDNSIYAFASGKVAMIFAPSWRAFDVKQINPNLRFKIIPIPQLPGSTVTWASYWVEGVSAKSKYQQAAWEFVNYITSKEGAMKLYTEASKTRLFGEPYARMELGSLVEGDPYVGAYVKQASLDARSFPLASRTFDNGINDKLIKYLEDAVNSMAAGTAPVAAINTMSSGFRQVLSTYGVSSSSVPATQ